MNPIGAVWTVILMAAVLSLPRKIAALAATAGICYITQGQQINVAGFHMTSIRLVLLAGTIRIFNRGELRALKFNLVDKSVLLFVIVDSIMYVVGRGTVGALVYQLGLTYNVLLSYFVFRSLFTTFGEVEEFVSGLALLIVPFAALMFLESLNGRNLFYIFGGVSPYDEFRDGHFRCAGAFRSPITGGTFGATLFSMFAGLFWAGKHRRNAIVGMVAATVITVSSHSSGPVLAYGASLIALIFWRARQHMRLLRRSLVVWLIFMHLIMKAPVWFLLGHISDVVGGGGWHRAEIIDAAVKYFGTWWFCGTDDTGNWVGTELSFGGADITNQFVSEGVNGGLLTMMCFIWIFVRSFSSLGAAMNKSYEDSQEVTKFLWALGAALLATMVNFFSVSYFDQIETVWYLLVAMISVAAFGVLEDKPKVEMSADDAIDESKEDFASPSLQFQQQP